MGKSAQDNEEKLKHKLRLYFQGRSTDSGVKVTARPQSAVIVPIYFDCDVHSEDAFR